MLNQFSSVKEVAEGVGMGEDMVVDMVDAEEALEVVKGAMEEEEVVMAMESAVWIMKSQKKSVKTT